MNTGAHIVPSPWFYELKNGIFEYSVEVEGYGGSCLKQKVGGGFLETLGTLGVSVQHTVR